MAVVATALLCAAACGEHAHPALSESSSTTTTASAPQAAPSPNAPLPSPDALSDLLTKLADPAVPADQKVGLVEGATPDDADKFNKFVKALQDNGYLPIGVTAENIAWSNYQPGNVTADVTIHSQAMTTGFTYPMEFKSTPDGGWQLSRTTAETLLTFGQNSPKSTSAPPASPSPSPTG